MKHISRPGAGILLHISSLPSPYGIGSLGKFAYEFVDFLERAGQTYWQVLPVGPTGFGDSPYQSFSAFAGNPYFIDLDILREEGLLTAQECEGAKMPEGDVDYGELFETRIRLLKTAWSRFPLTDAFDNFCRDESGWLDDYALFMALKYRFLQTPWLSWPIDIRLRRPEAVARCREEMRGDIEFWQFLQFKFYTQWSSLREYANSRGISIIGDMPLYVAADSADTWACRKNYLLGSDGTPWAVAGVPPDYFSKTGQLWGNTLYNWAAMEEDNYDWWRARIVSSAKLFDVVRIDHFCGISRFWAIPYGEETAEWGAYFMGPGRGLIAAIDDARGDTGIVAEDLGLLNGDVRALIESSGYPGMRVVQFGFDWDYDNDHSRHNHPYHGVVYTGTHDNDTTLGFLREADTHMLGRIREILELPPEASVTALDVVRHTMQSGAGLVIIPMQDYLELGSEARMNTPSTIGGNWRWRLWEGAFTSDLADKIGQITAECGRKENQ